MLSCSHLKLIHPCASSLLLLPSTATPHALMLSSQAHPPMRIFTPATPFHCKPPCSHALISSSSTHAHLHSCYSLPLQPPMLSCSHLKLIHPCASSLLLLPSTATPHALMLSSQAHPPMRILTPATPFHCNPPCSHALISSSSTYAHLHSCYSLPLQPPMLSCSHLKLIHPCASSLLLLPSTATPHALMLSSQAHLPMRIFTPATPFHCNPPCSHALISSSSTHAHLHSCYSLPLQSPMLSCSHLKLIHPCASSLLLLPSTAIPSHSQRRHHAVAVARDALRLRALHAPGPPHPTLIPLRRTLLQRRHCAPQATGGGTMRGWQGTPPRREISARAARAQRERSAGAARDQREISASAAREQREISARSARAQRGSSASAAREQRESSSRAAREQRGAAREQLESSPGAARSSAEQRGSSAGAARGSSAEQRENNACATREQRGSSAEQRVRNEQRESSARAARAQRGSSASAAREQRGSSARAARTQRDRSGIESSARAREQRESNACATREQPESSANEEFVVTMR
ncbi:unnamed protein product [Closterium sp. Naga37s-1]|nr:unnamed protein product [Closterium sp. Naga37s-1]